MISIQLHFCGIVFTLKNPACIWLFISILNQSHLFYSEVGNHMFILVTRDARFPKSVKTIYRSKITPHYLQDQGLYSAEPGTFQ